MSVNAGFGGQSFMPEVLEKLKRKDPLLEIAKKLEEAKKILLSSFKIGEKKQEKKEDKENYHCVERHYGSFERTLTLPEDAKAEDIDAKFKDGVLTINIKRQAKSAPKEVKKVEIKAA